MPSNVLGSFNTMSLYLITIAKVLSLGRTIPDSGATLGRELFCGKGSSRLLPGLWLAGKAISVWGLAASVIQFSLLCPSLRVQAALAVTALR